MADDTIMLDQAMDIDNDAPPAPSTDSTPTVIPRSPLRSRRDPTDPSKDRMKKLLLNHRRDAKVQKISSNPNVNRDKHLSYREQRRKRRLIKRNRRLRIQRAIISGDFEVRPLGDGRPSFEEEDDELPRQLQRLDKDIMTEALHESRPGLAFDPDLPLGLTDADMADLVQSVEEWQIGCARDGVVMLADKAGRLLSGFARDVLAIVFAPKRVRCEIGGDKWWEQVSRDYQRVKRIRWLTKRCMKLLELDEVESYPMWGYASFKSHADVVMDARKTPGMHPMVDKALAEAYEDEPTFVTVQPSTLRSLFDHFEAARSRYLANLNAVLVTDSQSNPLAHKPAHSFGMPSRNDNNHYDSSDDADDGARGVVQDSGVEDNAQLEEGRPSASSQWFLENMDRWMRLKNGKPQGGVDVDKLSALDLGDIKWVI